MERISFAMDWPAEILRQGASLAEIGALLGHHHPDTTRIYTKIDLKALHAVAQPWPGGVAMNSLRRSIEEYLAMRRSLGFKLREAGTTLLDFAAFMELRRASYITQALALAWAQKPRMRSRLTGPAGSAYVRQFARYRSATDPRTQIPALGSLPFQPKRAQALLVFEHEIKQLLHATLNMPLSPTAT